VLDGPTDLITAPLEIITDAPNVPNHGGPVPVQIVTSATGNNGLFGIGGPPDKIRCGH
jgi:hypothetical protein